MDFEKGDAIVNIKDFKAFCFDKMYSDFMDDGTEEELVCQLHILASAVEFIEDHIVGEV